MKNRYCLPIRLFVVCSYVLLLSTVCCSLPGSAQSTPPAGWLPFSPNSPWNTPIPANATLDPNSANYINDILTGGVAPVLQVHEDIPIFYINSTSTPVSIPNVYPDYDTRGGAGYNSGVSVPFPKGTLASLSSDHLMVFVDYANKRSWEFWELQENYLTGLINTCFFAMTWDLTSDGAYDTFPVLSVMEGGNPLFGGAVKFDEVKAGQIKHALIFGYDYPSTGLPRYPASSNNGLGTHQYSIPLGSLLRLDPKFNINDKTLKLTRADRIVAKALQTYGCYVCTNAPGAKYLLFQELDNNLYWNNMLTTSTLNKIPLSRFQVVNTSYLLPQAHFSANGTTNVVSGGKTQPLNGVTLTLQTLYPTLTQVSTTSSNGQFNFANLLNGTYTLTPDAVGYTFSPSSLTVTVSGAGATNLAFTATPNGLNAQYLTATACTTSKSGVSGSLTATYLQDESGTTYNTSNALWLDPGFDGYFTFQLPSGLSASAIKNLRLYANYWCGAPAGYPWQWNESVWSWEIYNNTTQSWEPYMDTGPILINQLWTPLQADKTVADYTPYFSGGKLLLRYWTSSSNYGSGLDFLQLRLLH